MSGDCGAANETIVMAEGSWQACEELCDNDGDCVAWVYSYSTGLCTEFTDPDCDTDNFEKVKEPDSVLGIFDEYTNCSGMCTM